MQFPRNVPHSTTMCSGQNFMNKRQSMSQEEKNYVGLDLLQDQTKMKALRRGFVFNLMIVGRSGLGKSTLVDTLFKSSVSPDCASSNNEAEDKSISSTTKIYSKTSVLNEKGVKLTLTVIDTPGFGDKVNNTSCWEPIITHINDQYAKYLEEEQKINRSAHITDSRVHCCLYFIEPTGHALCSLDIEVMKRLCKIVNVIPLIAKADTLTIEERESFKERIKVDLTDHEVFTYPNEKFEEGEDKTNNDNIRGQMPFAVVGSTNFHEVSGRKVLGRKTKWGVIEIENKQHSDFPALRDMIIRTHMTDLIEVTSAIHFEDYRMNKISSLANKSENNPTSEESSKASNEE